MLQNQYILILGTQCQDVKGHLWYQFWTSMLLKLNTNRARGIAIAHRAANFNGIATPTAINKA